MTDKRTVRWHNVYPSSVSIGASTRKQVDKNAVDGRIYVVRFECDEDGRNPEIFVEDV